MVGGELPPFDDDVWELYDGSSDYSQARNLAAERPEMLAKLQRLWLVGTLAGSSLAIGALVALRFRGVSLAPSIAARSPARADEVGEGRLPASIGCLGHDGRFTRRIETREDRSPAVATKHS